MPTLLGNEESVDKKLHRTSGKLNNLVLDFN
jgi:hypothetical protein